MSAPDTNTQKQADKHRGPLTGMFAVVLFALVLLGITIFWIAGRGGTPEGSRVSGATGESTTEDTTAVADDAAPLVQPEQVTGADASANEAPDTNPSESQVSTPPGEEPSPDVSADD